MPHDVDVIVAGGGPAGAMSALLLARLGLDVMLVERGGTLRHKTCGHCLNPRAMPLLDRAGLLDAVRRLASGTMRHLAVHVEQGVSLRTFTNQRRHGGEGLLVSRDRFDQMLRDAAACAGVEIIQPASVRLLARGAHSTRVRVRQPSHVREIACRLLVAADGVGSPIARAAGFANARAAGRKYGFSFDLPITPEMNGAIELGSINMFLTRAGYIGAVRQDDTMHLAALVSTHPAGNGRDPLHFTRDAALQHALLRRLGLDHMQQHDLLNFCAAGPMPWRPHTIAGPSVALVGDAAGYIEPFTGEGMTWAIEGALLLGETMERHRQQWSATAALEYATRWRERVQRRHRVCRMLAGALERPLVSRWMLRLGRAAPTITRRLVREVVTS